MQNISFSDTLKAKSITIYFSWLQTTALHLHVLGVTQRNTEVRDLADHLKALVVANSPEDEYWVPAEITMCCSQGENGWSHVIWVSIWSRNIPLAELWICKTSLRAHVRCIMDVHRVNSHVDWTASSSSPWLTDRLNPHFLQRATSCLHRPPACWESGHSEGVHTLLSFTTGAFVHPGVYCSCDSALLWSDLLCRPRWWGI